MLFPTEPVRHGTEYGLENTVSFFHPPSLSDANVITRHNTVRTTVVLAPSPPAARHYLRKRIPFTRAHCGGSGGALVAKSFMSDATKMDGLRRAASTRSRAPQRRRTGVCLPGARLSTFISASRVRTEPSIFSACRRGSPRLEGMKGWWWSEFHAISSVRGDHGNCRSAET